MSLDDIPKKTQYVIIDSNFVNGTNNTFSLDLQLESNTHVEDMGRVIGIKMVDFYITQVGGNDGTDTDIAKFVDIICPEVPKVAQILDERHGQILARVPLERHFAGSNDVILRDKQWKSFQRQTNFKGQSQILRQCSMYAGTPQSEHAQRITSGKSRRNHAAARMSEPQLYRIH